MVKRTIAALVSLALLVPRVGWAQEQLPPALSASPPAPPVVVVVQAAPGPTVRVHIDSPTPATLLHRAPGTTEFLRACAAPCDAELPLDDEYQFSGKGQKQNVFRLQAQPGQTVSLECNPADDSARTRGIVFAIVGAVGFNGSLILDYVALVAEALAASSNTNHDIANGLAITGGALTLVTGTMAIYGIVTIVGSSGSEATQLISLTKLPPPAVDTFADAHRSGPWLHRETAVAVPVMVPLFSRSF